MSEIPKTCGECPNDECQFDHRLREFICGATRASAVNPDEAPPSWCEIRRLHEWERRQTDEQPEPLDVRPAVFSPHCADCPFPEGEQPDTVPVPRAEYERLKAFAAFGERTFQNFWNDGEPCDLSGADVQSTAIECGLLRQAYPPPEEAEIWYVPAYPMEGKKPIAEQLVPIPKLEYERMKRLCDAAVEFNAAGEAVRKIDTDASRSMQSYYDALTAQDETQIALNDAAIAYAETKGGE